MDPRISDTVEMGMQLLNNCFDDIEKFVSRLQAAAEAYKELDRRSGRRGSRRRVSRDDMLSMRARPPPAEDFIDIFSKFKFSFNILGKLKAYIFDPGASEMIHFLFTPLSLIYEASRDSMHGGVNLGAEVVTPVLLPEAKRLLQKSLHGKEYELLQRLGRPWSLDRDEWSGYAPTYSPRFYNGWQPSHHMVEQINRFEGVVNSERFRDDDFRSKYSRGGSAYAGYLTDDRPGEFADPSWLDDRYY